MRPPAEGQREASDGAIMNRAVFFDRDGTLIEDVGYLSDPAQVRLLPGAAEAVRRLNRAGFLVVVVSNQSGVARGLYGIDAVERTNQRLQQLLQQEGAHIDAFYFCPHLPTGTVPAYAKECDCRKPKPGLLYRAAQDLDIDLTESYMVGDAVRDIQAGRAAHCHTIFLGDLSLADAGTRGQVEVFAEATAYTLEEAVRHILTTSGLTADEEEAAARPAGEVPAAPRQAEPGPGAPPRREAPAPEVPPSEPQEPSEAAGPPPGERTCSRCGRAITEEEVRRGLAIDREDLRLCPVCVVELQRKRSAAPEQVPADLGAVLDELRTISRALTFETFSVMNVLGGVVQVGVLGCLFKAYQLGVEPGSGAVTMLLWAIALQLVALTCFILGRR